MLFGISPTKRCSILVSFGIPVLVNYMVAVNRISRMVFVLLIKIKSAKFFPFHNSKCSVEHIKIGNFECFDCTGCRDWFR